MKELVAVKVFEVVLVMAMVFVVGMVVLKHFMTPRVFILLRIPMTSRIFRSLRNLLSRQVARGYLRTILPRDSRLHNFFL